MSFNNEMSCAIQIIKSLGKERKNCSILSEELNQPKCWIHKICKKLTEDNLISSKQGYHGGYTRPMLSNRKFKRVTMLQIHNSLCSKLTKGNNINLPEFKEIKEAYSKIKI